MNSKNPRDFNRDYSEAGLKITSPLARVQKYLEIFKASKGEIFDADLIRHVNAVSASEGKVEFEFTVTKPMCNSTGTMHGGCIATMMDDLTSMPALTIAKAGFLDGGTMSRTLTCTYLRAIMPGEKIRVVCEVVAAGKSFVHVRGDMIREDGKIAVSCIHDKVPRHKSKL